MPNRILRDGILTSEAVNSLSCLGEVFYRRLMSVVDDYGRYFAKPSLVRAACYPLQLERVKDMDVVKMMAEVCNTKPTPLVLAYEVSGKQYLQLENFKQQVRTNAKFPAPPDALTSDLSASDITKPDSDSTKRDSAHLGGVGVGGVVEGGVGVGVVISAAADSERPKPSAPAGPCPHVEIIRLFGERLPMGRQVRPELWNGQRARMLQARWREDKKRQTIGWWADFFDYCAKSPFLSGKVSRPGRDPFQVSLDWLITPGNFAKVMEGAYER